MSDNPKDIAGIRRSIIRYSTIAAFLACVVSALTAATPFYSQLYQNSRQSILELAETHSHAISELVRRVKDVAAQIASRTRARDLLVQYNNAQIDLVQFERESRHILTDALNTSRNIVGIARLSQEGTAVVEVGAALHEDIWPANVTASRDVLINGPVNVAGKYYVVVSAPILDAAGQRLGTDLVLFSMTNYDEDVFRQTGIGTRSENFIAYRDGEQLGFLASKGANPFFTGVQARASDWISHINEAWGESNSGLWESPGYFVAYAKVPGIDWYAIVKVTTDDVLTGLYERLTSAIAVVLAVATLSALGMFVVVNPLAGGMFVHASSLQEQVEAKTAALRAELAERELLQKQLFVAKQSLEHRAAELRASNEELESFSYSVSHDLRAPLRSMTGFGQALVEDYGDKLDETGKDYVQRISAASKRMGRLIDDLLTLSRVTRTKVKRVDVDLSSLAETIADQLRQCEPDRQVEFRIEPGVTARGDETLLRTVLENLLGNAWKYSGKTPCATIEFGVAANGAEPAFFIRDNGVGFDMAHADKLFKPFQRLHSGAEFEGTGIGLASVANIIRRHGGRIWAESEPGAGTTMRFKL